MSQPGSNFDQRIPGPPFGAPRGPPPAGMQSAPQSGVNPFGLRQRGKNPYAKQPSAFLPPTNQGIGPPPTGPSSFPSQLDPNPTMPFGTMPYQGRTDQSSGSLSWPNSPGGQPPISGSPASLPPVLQPSQQQGNFNLFNPKPQVNGAFEPSEPSPVQSSPSIDSINSRFGRLALDSPTVSSGVPNQRGAQLAHLEGADPCYMDESDEVSTDDDSDDNDLTSDELSSDDAADINGRQDLHQEQTLLSQVGAVNPPDANISSNQASQQVVHQNITDSFNQGNFNPLGPGQPLNPPFSAVQSDTGRGASSNFPPSDNILNSFENHGPINLFQGSSTSEGNQVNSNNQQTHMKQQYQSQQPYEKPTSHSTTFSQHNQPPFERTESVHSSHSQSQFERIASQSSIHSNHNQSPFDRTDSHSSAGSMAGGSIGGQEPYPSAFKPVLSSRKPNSDSVGSSGTTNQLGQVYSDRAIGDQSCALPFLPDNSSGSLSDGRMGMGKDSEPSSSDFSSESSSKSVVENTKYLNMQDHGSSHAQQVDSSMQAPVMPAGFDPQEQSSPAHQLYAGQHEKQEPTSFNEPSTTGTVVASFDQQPNQIGLNEIPNQKVTNLSHGSSDHNEIDANSFDNKYHTNQTQNTDQSNTHQISQFSPSAPRDLPSNAYSGTADQQQGQSGHLPSNTAGKTPSSYHTHPLPNAGNNFGITLHNNQNMRDRRFEDSFNARNTGGLNAAQDENRHHAQLLKQDNAACLQSAQGPSIGSQSVEDTAPTLPSSQGFDGQHQQQPSKLAINNQSVQGSLTSQSGNASNPPSRESVSNPARITDFAGRQSTTAPLQQENLSQAFDQNQVGVNQPMQPNYETENHQMQSSSSHQEFNNFLSGSRQDNTLISGKANGAPQQGINQMPLPHQTEQLIQQSALPHSVQQYGSSTQTLVGNAKASTEQTSIDNFGQSQATEPSRELPSSPQKNQDLAGMFSESAASQLHGNTLMSQQLQSNQLNQQYTQLISNSNQSQQNVSRPQLLQENIAPQQNQQESLLRHQGLPQQQYANQSSQQQPGDIQCASQNQQTRQPSSLSSEQDQVQKQPSSMPEQQQPPDNQLQQSHHHLHQMQGNAQMPQQQNIQQFPKQQENSQNPQQQQFGIRQFPQQEKSAQLQHGIKQYPQQVENTQQPQPQQQGTNQFLQQQENTQQPQQQQQNVNQLPQQRENTQQHLQQQQNVNQPPLQRENTLQSQQQQQGFKQFPQAQLQNQEQLPQQQSQPNSLPQQQQADQFDKQQQSSQQQLPQQLPNNQQQTEQQQFSQHQQHEQSLPQSELAYQETPQHPQNMQAFPQTKQNVQQGQLTTQQLNQQALPLNQQQFNQQLQNRQQFATNGDNDVHNQDRLTQLMQNQAQLPQQSQSQQNLPQQQQNQPQLPPSSQNQQSFSQQVPQQSQNQQQQLPNDNQLPQQQQNHGQLPQQMQGQQQLPQQVQNQQLQNLGQLPQQQQIQQQLPNQLSQQLQNQQQLPHQQQFPHQPQNQQQFPNQPQSQQQFPNQPQNQQQFPNQPQNQQPFMQQQQQNQPQMQNQNDFMRQQQQQQQLNQQGQQPYFQQNPMQNPALNNPTSSFQNSHYNNMSPSVAAQQMQNYDPRYMQMNQNMQGWNPNANYGQNYNDYYNWYCNMYSNWANYGYGGYGQQFPGQYPGGAGSWDTRSHHSSRSSYVSSRNPSEIDVDSRPSSVLENRPTANDLEIEALEMSKKEISTFQKDSPVEMERLTPLHFYKPHITASFSHFGGCIVVDPNDPNENQTPSVICVPNKNLVTTSELQEFPGPLIRGETSKKSILMFTKTKSRQWLARTDMKKEFSDSMSLLWDFMTMLIKHNGIIDGPDVAELLMQHKPATDIGHKMGAMLHAPDDVNKIPRTVAEEQYREFLLQGSKKEALDFAVNHDLWGHALILSYKIDPKLHNAVMNKLIASMDNDDSLVSLYGHLSGRGLPSQSCHAVRSGNADWREHLAMLIANPTKNLERDKKNIIVIGDALAEQGNVGAAHLCYLLAGVKLSKCNENGSKICLLGVNHKKENSSRVDLWAKNEFIQLTEIYEFALRQSKNSYIPAFQRMKLLYVNRLYEVGMLAEAFGYCETVAEAVLSEPRSYDLDFLVLFSDVCQRLFYLSMESPEDPEPEWYGRIWRLVELKESNADLSEDWSKSSEPSAPTSSVQTPQHTSRAASSQDSHPEYTNELTGTSDTQPVYYQPASQGVMQEAAGDSVQETAQHQTVQNVNEINQSEAQQVATDGQWNPNQSNYQTDGNNYGQNQPSYQADYTDGPAQQQDQYTNQQENQYQEQRPDQYQEHQQQPEQYQNQQPDQYQNQQPDQYKNQQQDQYQDQQPDWNQQGYTQQEYNQQGYDQQQMQNQMFSPETSYQQYSDQNIQDYGYQAYQDQTNEGLPDSSNQKSYEQQTPADEDDQEDIYDVFGNKKKRAGAKDQKVEDKDDKKVDDSKSKKGENKTDNGKNQQKGWISSFVSKILPNRPKEAFLPDDKDKSIYWDEKKGKYVNKDEPDKPYTPPPPPPTDSQLTSSLKPSAQNDAFSPLPTPASFPSPVVERKRNAPEPNLPTPDSGEQKVSPAPSKFSRTAHGIGKRGNRYVNSFSGMHKKDATDAPPAASLFNPMGAPQALPTNFFVPQAPAPTNENDDNNGNAEPRPSEGSQRPQNQPPQSQPMQPPRQPQQQPAQQQQQPPQQQPTFFNPASMQQNQNSSRNRPRYQR